MRLSLPLACFTLAACGSSGGAFVGTWQIDTGPDVFTCDGTDNGSLNVTGTMTVKTGLSGDLVLVNPFGCALSFAPNGDAAALQPGQSCTEAVQGDNQLDSFTSGTATLTDSTAMTVVLGGAAQGDGQTCTFSFTATLTKISDT